MIVITGGAGFIGSALIQGLNRRGFGDIVVVDSAGRHQNRRNLVYLRIADFVEKDEFIGRLEQGSFDSSIGGIIHMGACSSTTEKDGDFLMQNNYEYTKRLALWSAKNDKRFVYASTAATYGNGNKGFSDGHLLLSSLRPLNPYAYSKHLFDLWALHNGYLQKIAGLKYFNVYGPNEYHKADMRSMVLKAFEQINTTGKVDLFKSYNSQYKHGWQMRDFIYIKDVVDMTLFIFEKPDANGIFNIGTGVARGFYELLVSVFDAVGKEREIEYIDMPESIRDKYQYFTQADIAKLRTIGYKKRISSLEEGVTDYVQNYLMMDNPYLARKN